MAACDSLEADTSPRAKTPEVPQNPKTTSSDDMDGKKLAMAVSESPTISRRGSLDADEDAELPSIPDSPCPAFLSFDEMEDADELEGCFGRQPENESNFPLLPCLGDEEGEKRVSPPMMPGLGQSLSWEAQESSGGYPPGTLPR